MNIKDDYLWDGTGKPDSEIQQLEDILGTLRHQPRPLEIPATLQIVPERNVFRGFVPRLAIAATIALIVLGLGLWLGLQQLRRGQPSQVVHTPTRPEVSSDPTPLVSSSPERKHIEVPRRSPVNHSLLAGTTRSPHREVRKQQIKDSAVALNEHKEAEARKDQLLLALRMASAKLNFAQKKTQSTTPRDLIHNQHKLG